MNEEKVDRISSTHGRDAYLGNFYVPDRPAQVWMGYSYNQTYLYVHSRVSIWIPKLQQTGTWSATPWRPRGLCYRPPVFFHQLRLTDLSFPQENIRRVLKKIVILLLLLFLNWKSVSINGLHYTATDRVGPLIRLRYSLTFIRAWTAILEASGCFANLFVHFEELFFLCGAATQRGSWPPHSWGF
jgi:hypothetical protein